MQAESHSHQVAVQLGVTALAGPKIKWSGGQLVDQRFGASIFREIDTLDICFADVAAFHANVIEVARRKDGKLFVVLLAAARANDAAKLPLGKAEGADHGSRSAIAH